jgi:two-component system, NarL family, sensor kinase
VTRELKMLRYGLIIVPSFITMYVYEYDDYGRFTLHLLMLLLLVALGSRLPDLLVPLLCGLEMLLTAWLCYQYGSLMLFSAISALLVYSRLLPRYIPAIFTLIHLILLNVAFIEAGTITQVFANLTFLMAYLLSDQLNRMARGRDDTLMLYDELRKRHFELDEARSRLMQYAAQVENAAQTEERVRIARQLHDDIGHRLIRVKMMMEAAIHTLPSSPDTGLAMMGQIRDQVAASMDDMRAAVKRINHAPQLEGAYALDRLLEETGRDTGIVTSYSVEGVPFALYPSLQIVLYKNAREALTNALRHGEAKEVWIKVTYSEGEVTMEVGNNGVIPDTLPARPGSGAGMGLKGMTERTRLVGGALELRLQPHFTVITRLPVVRVSEIR